MTKEEVDADIQQQLARIEERGDDAEDSEDQLPERVVEVHTQKIEGPGARSQEVCAISF